MNSKDQPTGKAKELHHHLSEQFRQLQPKDRAPEELKNSVFGTLDTLQLIADVADLFTVKFAISNTHLLGLSDFTPDENADASDLSDDLH